MKAGQGVPVLRPTLRSISPFVDNFSPGWCVAYTSVFNFIVQYCDAFYVDAETGATQLSRLLLPYEEPQKKQTANRQHNE